MKFLKMLGSKKEQVKTIFKAAKKKSLIRTLMKVGAFFATLSLAIQVMMFVLMFSVLLFAGAAILNFFSDEEEDILEKYQIKWDDYTCTCTFLTAEEIEIVKAGGQVALTPDNSGGLNISGGSVAGSGVAQGLKIPSMGQAKTDTQYGIPIWTGYSMSDTGQDIIVPITTDSRTESKVYTSQSGSVADTMTVAERANQGIVTTESFSGSTVKVIDGRLAVAVASGFLAWPDDPDHSSTMIGLNFDVVLKNGEVIPCVSKDAKANVHTGDLHMFYAGGYYRSNIPAEKRHIDSGTSISVADYSFLEFISCPREAPSWLKNYIVGAGGIDHVKIYNHGRGEAAAKTVNPNAFDASKITAGGNAGGNNTSSFGAGGSGQVVNNGTVIPGLSATASANANQVYTILTGLGYSPAATLGIMGNIWQETTFNPNLWGPGVKSGTWASQSSTYYTLTQTNKANLPLWIDYLNTQNLSIDTVEGQIKGLDWTMSVGPEKNLFSTYPANDYKISLEQFKSLTDPILACDYFMTAYERATGGTDPSITGKSSNKYQHLENRKNYTRTLMDYYGVSSGSTSGIASGAANNALNHVTGNTPIMDGNSGGRGPLVSSNSGTSFTDGEKIGLDSSWEYASFSVINSGKATYYRAKGTPKNICVAVNAGHGCSGGSSKKTKSHPDGTAKVTGGTTAAGNVESTAISSGTEFKDGTAEAVINLKVALVMKEELLNRGYDVLMIRETSDEQLDNIARTVISNNIADAHIAIHFDGSESDKGVFYMSVPNVDSYRNMVPVKDMWQEHTKLGEAVITGLSNNGYKKYNNGALEQDLTQTSYSTIPSIDIELGDKITPHADSDCDKFGKALADGVDEYFKTATPVNQGKRTGSGLSAGNSVSGDGGALGTVNNAGNSVSGVVNKNTANLRTSCRMKAEGICGCYISDPNCPCHVFGGSDGVLGTDDDNLEGEYTPNADGTGTGAGGNPEILQVAQVAFNAMYNKGEYGADPYNQGRSKSLVVNGATYGVRWDCSGYVGLVCKLLGAPFFSSSTAPTTSTFSDLVDTGKIQESDAFIVLPYKKEDLQPGDIRTASIREYEQVNGWPIGSRNGKGGHVEIFAYWSEAGNPNSTPMGWNWGSDGGINGYPKDASGYVTGPKGMGTNNYKWIIRYVGSGGAGR